MSADTWVPIALGAFGLVLGLLVVAACMADRPARPARRRRH
ncbi:hypothetical protein ACFXCZ_27320 [Streptomyces sp. NPDC059396]